jgi:DNA-binding NtrC family response regulator
MQASSMYTMKAQNAIATVLPKMASPELLLVSIDDSFARLVNNVASPRWLVERRNNTSDGARALARSGVRLVVFDDQAVAESERGWLLAQVRKQKPGVPLLYVASIHNDETEILARRGGASYYTSKPIHDRQWTNVLRSFMQLHA